MDVLVLQHQRPGKDGIRLLRQDDTSRGRPDSVLNYDEAEPSACSEPRDDLFVSVKGSTHSLGHFGN